MLIIILIVAFANFSVLESETITKGNVTSMEFTNGHKKKSTIWFYTNDDVALEASKGDNHFMYDRFFIDENFDNINVSLYAIFDGDIGSEAAQYAIENLMPFLKAQIKTSKHNNENIDYVTLLRQEIIKTEKSLFEKRERSGTRVVIAVVDGEMVHIASVGNAKAVIYYEASETPDGQIIATNNDGDILKMFGNFQTKEKPYEENDINVSSYEKLNSKFIILASASVWKKNSNENAVKVVKSNMKNGILVAAMKLVEDAYNSGATDNLTVIIINTQKRR